MYIQKDTIADKIPKKQNASRGFSNKSKKPRKKNLIAGGNINAPKAITTPNST